MAVKHYFKNISKTNITKTNLLHGCYFSKVKDIVIILIQDSLALVI